MWTHYRALIGDIPTIGLILCSKKNEAVAKDSVLGEGRRLFAAKDAPVLATEAELGRELARVRGRRPMIRAESAPLAGRDALLA